MDTLFSDYFLPVTLAIITMGMGLSLTEKDFRNILVQPKAIVTGIFSQIVILPAIAFFVASLTNLDPVFKVGLVIIAACPGGATSNLITYILTGNIALSISMTAVNSLITLITIPFIVSLGLEAFIQQSTEINLPIGDTILKIFFITIVPAFTGTRIRKWKTEFADKLEKPLKIILPLLLLVVYMGVIFIDQGTEQATRKDFLSLIPSTLSLNFAAMLAGWMIARIMNLGKRNRFTIAIEVGLQNSALAIFVSSFLLKNQSMALVAVVYGSFTFFTTLLFGWIIKKIS
ncbi:MAG TPA: bile acid:sodium symporter family protein [Bacteroidaceae bacterium]|nr:bile acid:sodium symporter family protein [Bacteroidaceae bacterium]